MNTRLYNARILTMEDMPRAQDGYTGQENAGDRGKYRPVFQGQVWVQDDRIAGVAAGEEEAFPEVAWDLQVDCREGLLMPGFKDAHTHSAMTFLRSYADDLPLDRWLKEKVFPMEARLTGEDIYQLTRLAVLEYLSGGITSIFEMYLDPGMAARACVDMGMRCVLTSGLNRFTSSLERQEEEYLKWNSESPLVSYRLGFHSEYTCSLEQLQGVAGLAEKYQAPVFTHLAETAKEVEECRGRYGMTPAVFLDSLGIFQYGGGGYHCVHMSPGDMEVFEKRGLFAVTNPASNLKLASGMAPVEEFVRRGIPVAIGTDGPASNNCLDMFREMFLVTGLQKAVCDDPEAVPAREVLKMATVNGARACGLPECDSIAEGKKADLILIDLNQPNMQPLRNLDKNLVYSGSKSNVKMTMIGGKVLYRDGEFYLDSSREEIFAKANEYAEKIFADL